MDFRTQKLTNKNLRQGLYTLLDNMERTPFTYKDCASEDHLTTARSKRTDSDRYCMRNTILLFHTDILGEAC